MKYIKYLWILIFLFIIWWIYYFFIGPNIFKDSTITVPNVEGLKEDDAKNVLSKKDIKYEVYYVEGETNKVLLQSPKEGMKIYKTFKMSLYIENLKALKYKDFSGLIYLDNIDEINNYCINNKISYIVNYVYDENKIDGIILNQSKTEDDIISYGDVIYFDVVRNEETFKMPNIIGLNIYDAIEIFKEYNLNFNFIYVSSILPCDTVVDQGIKEGSIIKKDNNNVIDIYISNGSL